MTTTTVGRQLRRAEIAGIGALLLFSYSCRSSQSDLFQLEKAVTTLMDKVGPNVVYLSVASTDSSKKTTIAREGCGVLINQSEILTTYNLLVNYKQFKVQLQNGRTLTSESTQFIRGDFETNVALIKFNEPLGPESKLSIARETRPGSVGIALGNTPYSKGLSVAIGPLGKSWVGGVDAYDNNLLTFSANNFGGCPGTPVFNGHGQFVGLVEGRFADAESPLLVIPAKTLLSIAERLKKDSTIDRGFLGVFSHTNCQAFYGKYEKEVATAKSAGVYLSGVVPNSPAARIGIKEGDQILSINDQPVNSCLQLRRAVSGLGPGSIINVRLNRWGKIIMKQITVDKLPPCCFLSRRCADRPL